MLDVVAVGNELADREAEAIVVGVAQIQMYRVAIVHFVTSGKNADRTEGRAGRKVAVVLSVGVTMLMCFYGVEVGNADRPITQSEDGFDPVTDVVALIGNVRA